MEKYIWSDTFCDLAEVLLKNNLQVGGKTLKQKRGTGIGTKFVPPYGILFMAELEEEIFGKAEFKCIYGGGTSMIYFSCGNMDKKN